MARASCRKRKNKITCLDQKEGLIVEDDNILQFATSFHGDILGPVTNNTNISLDIALDNVLSESDGFKLEKHFSLEEIKFIVFYMNNNKARDLDGLKKRVYQHFLS